MQPRPLDPKRDFPAMAGLLGRTRAGGGLSHPGGIQWWLRELGDPKRPQLEAFLWGDGEDLSAFALVDDTFNVNERLEGGPALDEQLDFLEAHLRATGRESLMTHAVEGTEDVGVLESRGYERSGSELELIADLSTEPPAAPLPDGFRLVSLNDVTDEAYIEGHVAAWSDTKPSSYRRELHEAVKKMPQFRPDLVTVALAPNGTVAACCIGWFDPVSNHAEIEPLGTHRDYRRLGLGAAIVREVQHRVWAEGATEMLVWNDPANNAAANGLYTNNGMPPRRHLVEMTKSL
jgi:GNAT superfamily N-acetyltransferase